MANCYALLKACKRVGERKDWGFNWTHELARKWKPYQPYALGIAVRPSRVDEQTGLEYLVTTAGQTDSDEPEWPIAAGGTVVSGSVTFTAQAISADSLEDSISASTWSSGEPTIVVDDDATSATAGLQATSAFVAGGVTRRTHDIVNEVITLAGRTLEGVLRLRIDP
jgi:hypothetical protein